MMNLEVFFSSMISLLSSHQKKKKKKKKKDEPVAIVGDVGGAHLVSSSRKFLNNPRELAPGFPSLEEN